MYRKFYGLKEKPFHLIPNPQFLYLSKKHQNALTYLEYGLSEGSGFILLTGDIGSGKTTIIRHILNRFDDDIEVALIANTNVDSGELIHLVLHEFGIETTYDSKAKALDAVFRYLIAKFSQRKRVLLIIDEAQNLSIQALEEVRMLSNLQTDEHMLLQIMLVGQPELRRKLQLPELFQLSQRIAVFYHLGALEREEIPEYLAFRLEKVGGSLEIFAPETFDLIYEASGGIPRIMNLLCDTALVYGYADAIRPVTLEVFSQVIKDKEGFGLIAMERAEETDSESGKEHIGSLEQRLMDLEEKVAALHQQVEQLATDSTRHEHETQERLIAELTAILRHERDRNDALLLEYAHLKAQNDLFANKEYGFGPVFGADHAAVGGRNSFRDSSDPDRGKIVAEQKNGQEEAEHFFSRLSSPEISMIDIHCHILPDIDDGSKNFEESVAMARMAFADGIAAIVATPHLNATLYDPVEISRRVSWLKHLLRKENVPVTIMPGATVSALLRPDQVKGFTLNETTYILIEFPHTHLPENAGEILGQFVDAGYKPIVAQPERNAAIIANPKLLLDVLTDKVHCYVQLTGGSLTGAFGVEAQHCAQHLLRSGVVDVIATNAHSCTSGKPQLSTAVQAAAEIVGAEAAQRMVFGTPVKIISGLSL